MTFTSLKEKAAKSLSISKNEGDLDFSVHGQGIFIFNSKNKEKVVLRILTADKTKGLLIELTKDFIKAFDVQNPDTKYIDPKCKQGLTEKAGAYYWISLDSQNLTLKVGVGEPRPETSAYSYTFESLQKSFLEALICIEQNEDIIPLRLVRDPITQSIPLRIKNTDDLTMDDIASGTILTSSSLSFSAKKLYDCISGKKFLLDTPDFPDFSRAIEHSIRTPGLWCYERLKQKANEFSKDKPFPDETYLRITLGQNNGESPGIPYVMEIWPVGHYSPVHNHGSANAIIRILSGQIHVSLFPYLCSDISGVDPFVSSDFKQGDITWISPTLNQVHQLKNLSTNKEACITIQCYMYEDTDSIHYDYFDYLDPKNAINQYDPDSDMEFLEFKKTIKREYLQRKEAYFNFFCL
jgi:hypothetical protein